MKNEWTKKSDQKMSGSFKIDPKQGFAPNFGQYSFKFQFDDEDPVEVALFAGNSTVTITVSDGGSIEFTNGDRKFKLFVEET